jgi:hypothetical protein
MFVELDNSRYFCRLNVLRKVPLAPLLMGERSISNGPGAPAKIFLIILWGSHTRHRYRSWGGLVHDSSTERSKTNLAGRSTLSWTVSIACQSWK